MKVGIYARYSSDNQRDASIADQLRICRTFAERQRWTIAEEYSDHAVSGATLLRPGFQSLMRDALNRRFDVVLAESLDRFSRDQEDTAGLFKRLTFAGVNIVTLAEGDITHLHIGFKGTMNALFLKDLAEKTHRGLRGRIEDGKSAGGLCYGYRVVKTISGGSVTTGEREIEPTEAPIVERIFRDFVAGVSPKQIAKNLNREAIAGPFGGPWSPSTIYGNARLEGQRPRPPVGDHGTRDRHLAIADLPERPAVRALHADGVRPLLGKTRVVKGEDAGPGRHLRPQVRPYATGIPRRMGDEVVERLVARRVAQPSVHRLHGLALAVIEEPVQVLAGGRPLRLSRETATERVHELAESSQQRACGIGGHAPDGTESRPSVQA